MEWLKSFLIWDFLRYLIVPGVAFVWLHGIRKSAWSSHLIQKSWSTRADHLREIRYLIPSVAVFALMGALVVFGSERGIFQLHFQTDEPGWISFVVLVIMVLGHDTYFYWTHRWMHHRRVFPLFHRIHHFSRNPSPWSAYSFSVPEAFVQAAYVPLFLFLFPVHVGVLAIFLAHMSIRSVLAHVNVEVFPDWLRGAPFWIATSTHHNLHHQNYRFNYGIYFRFWDRVMGTEDPAYVGSNEKALLRKPKQGLSS